MPQQETEATSQILEEELPGWGGAWQGIKVAAGPGGPQAIQQEVEKSP